jgi:hypothetical protein
MTRRCMGERQVLVDARGQQLNMTVEGFCMDSLPSNSQEDEEVWSRSHRHAPFA